MKLPLAELHVHLNGTLTRHLFTHLLERYRDALGPAFADLEQRCFDAHGRPAWDGFHKDPEGRQHSFHDTYDYFVRLIRSPDDLAAVTYDYLRRSFEQGVLYVELMTSASNNGDPETMFAPNVTAIAGACERARHDFGIEARLIITAKRHLALARTQRLLDVCLEMRHPLITGFGLAGDENRFPATIYRDLFRRAHEAGLHCTIHSGETGGPEEIWSVLRDMPFIRRLGHGVRAAEDPALVIELARRGTVLEICPTSNLKLGLYPDLATHPFARLWNAGVACTLNTDDPGLFFTGLGAETQMMMTYYALREDDVLAMTRTALEAAFVDDITRARLLLRLEEQATALRAMGRIGPNPYQRQPAQILDLQQRISS